jgi:hypothetical protein
MIEPVNSVIREFFNKYKSIPTWLPDLIAFHWNNRHFQRGKRKGCTPRVLLKGKAQGTNPDWIEQIIGDYPIQTIKGKAHAIGHDGMSLTLASALTQVEPRLHRVQGWECLSALRVALKKGVALKMTISRAHYDGLSTENGTPSKLIGMAHGIGNNGLSHPLASALT